MTSFEGFRIGFDAKRAYTNRSGLGSYSRNIAVSLIRNYPSNKYILFTPRRHVPGVVFNDQDFEVVTPRRPAFKIMPSVWRNFFMAGVAKKAGLDLFHGLSNELPRGMHKSGIPSVVTVHDLVFLKFPGFYQPADRLIYARKVKYACQTANKIIAVSSQTKNDLVQLLGIDPEKIEVVYQPIAGRFFENHDKKRAEEVKLRYNLPENFILSVGTVEERKNQLNILRAVVSKKIDREVIFVGRMTAYSRSLLGFISRHKLEKQVRFITELQDAELPSLYRLAGVLAYPSLYEGFGIPVIEAMATGCPVLASDAPCLPETAGGAAMLCNPTDPDVIGECLKTILGNSRISSGLSGKGLVRAQVFKPENSAKNLVSVYESVLKDGK